MRARASCILEFIRRTSTIHSVAEDGHRTILTKILEITVINIVDQTTTSNDFWVISGVIKNKDK